MGNNCPYCGKHSDGTICMNCAQEYENDYKEKIMDIVRSNQLESAQAYSGHSDCPICNPVKKTCIECGEKFIPNFYDDNICEDCEEKVWTKT